MHKFKNSISSLFLVSVFFNSCNGQIKTDLPKKIIDKQLSFTNRQSKLIKTLGTDLYQNVHCSLQDKNGTLWFGTTGEGVYSYDGKLFTQFTEKDGLSNNKVWAILEDKTGNIWFATSKGVSLYDGKNISTISISINSSIDQFQNISVKHNNSANNAVWSMMQDKKGMIWFGTDDGLYCYDGKKFSYFLDDPGILNKAGLSLKSVQCMLEDKNGRLWFGSGPQASEGICLFEGGSLTNFKPQKETWIRKIIEDKNGMLFFNTRHNGLIQYDGKDFSNFYEPQALRNDLLTIVFIDSKGNTWYGSDYTGNNDITTGAIWKFDGRSFVEFTKKDGISNTSIYSITEDKAGNIWVGTRNTGLYRYDGKSFINFSE